LQKAKNWFIESPGGADPIPERRTMITYVKDSLFESPAKVLVNTVNTVGVMGRGLARNFKEIYPEMFRQYQQLCERKQFQVGKLWVYKTDHKWIMNFPTKVHWRQPSKPEYVEAGLKTFVSTYAAQGITSVAFPRLGCGNGELVWESEVRPLMVKYLSRLPIDIFVHDFGRDYATPEHKDIQAMTAWLRSEPRALAFSEVWTDLGSLIGDGLQLRGFDGASRFKAFLTTEPTDGLLFHIDAKNIWELVSACFRKFVPRGWRPQIVGPGRVFVPQDAMLDLWQNVRAYGFCVLRIIPPELEALAPFVMALLSRLEYMKRVEISHGPPNAPEATETGLRLFASPRPPETRPAHPLYLVQPV
jgi:O-acetyl-ADP-ribose deacetylase (regulator of RNase III)